MSNLPPPPEEIYLVDIQPGRLIFSWTASGCSIVWYDVTSDCGICTVVINTTTAMCSNLQLSTNARLCHFRVSSVACDLNGNPSSPVAVTLKGNIIIIYSGSQKMSSYYLCVFIFFTYSSQCSTSRDYSQLF